MNFLFAPHFAALIDSLMVLLTHDYALQTLFFSLFVWWCENAWQHVVAVMMVDGCCSGAMMGIATARVQNKQTARKKEKRNCKIY